MSSLEDRFNLFQSYYEKNLVVYGREGIYEPLTIDLKGIIEHLKKQETMESVPLAFGVRIGKDHIQYKNLLIFERIAFRMEQLELFDYLLNDPEDLLGGLFFINCRFYCNYGNTKPIRRNLCFRNCVFSRDLVLTDTIEKMCIFTDCDFERQVSLKDTTVLDSMFIEKCRFGEDSSFNLENTRFTDPDKMFVISETIFEGPVFANNLETNATTEFKKLTFYKSFDFSKADFGPKSVFENFAYGNANTKEIMESKKILKKTLKANGYENQIAKLDLIVDEAEGFDFDSYLAAYNSGHLNTEYAAYLLEKSSNYLAKKRVDDRKQITRESIPYLGTGKNITYPIDALLAFKAKDWIKLKELRQKYNFTAQNKEQKTTLSDESK